MAFLFDGGSNLQCYILFLIIKSIMVVLIDLGGMIKCVIKYSFYCVCMYVYLKWMTLSIFFLHLRIIYTSKKVAPYCIFWVFLCTKQNAEARDMINISCKWKRKIVYIRKGFFRANVYGNLRGRYRPFSYIHYFHTCAAFPINNITQQSGAFVTSGYLYWNILIVQSPYLH